MTPVARVTGPAAQAEEGDSYPERLAKYFPVETGGAYTIASGVVLGTTDANTLGRTVWLLVIFVALLILTIPYLARIYPRSRYRRPWQPILLGCGAFVVWVYAQVTLPQEIHIYSAVAVGVLPILYAVAAKVVVPEPPPMGSADSGDEEG
ncbi:hypothetical protein I0Q12_03400 [Rhodococcus sp. CX]|uniref:hypothetical protein n=1 Tax=Rhodococcus sp. CX TaxID=2789880 RepID=UPI0018CF8CD1|nr:hypothetical protein [Rhodococcus sp. CX]MBH0118627.1 hypothetical protein [Rhodococcus sp. CX]